MCLTKHTCCATCRVLLFLLITGQTRAAVLVAYTFGDSVATATNLPQSVATNLSATPVVGWNSDTLQVVAHSFVQWLTGDMAMRLTQQNGGGRMFRFALQADPGFAFQVTDAAFVYGHHNTYGGGRNVSVKANLDPEVTWYDIAGGDMTANDDPGSFGWKAANWNAFVLRTDLTSLLVNISMKGNGSSSVADLNSIVIAGEVLAIPEPAALNLLPLGAWLLARRRANL